MKIALVGYGKMGHLLKETAESFGHSVVATIDPFAKDATSIIPQGDKDALFDAIIKSGAEGIIEFSHPEAVMFNINTLLPTKIPMVVGTTGWVNKEDEVKKLAEKTGGTIMHSANFSVGVNLFYKIIEQAARLVSEFPEYDDAIWEMHHNQKADSPSGTALEIARHLMAGDKRKTEIITDAFHSKPLPNQLHVSSTRCGSVPGTHTVFFDSLADTIEITHTARSRAGFAAGAVHSIERLSNYLMTGKLKAGYLYGMNDLFN